MGKMLPRFAVAGVALASLMILASGCVWKSDLEAKEGELKKQTEKLTLAEKAKTDFEAKIKTLETDKAELKTKVDTIDPLKEAKDKAEASVKIMVAANADLKKKADLLDDVKKERDRA